MGYEFSGGDVLNALTLSYCAVWTAITVRIGKAGRQRKWAIESLQRLNDMRHIFPVSLIALSCGILSGCAGVRAERSGPVASSNSSGAQSQNAIYVDSKDGPRYEDWKSCIELLYPNGSRSVSDLQQAIQSPHDIRQLVENLKQAWTENFLIQPVFFEDTILQKFFSGSSLKWRAPVNYYIHQDAIIQVQLESDLLPGMTVTIESRCWRIDDKPGLTAHLAGSLKISGGPIPGLTLRSIRKVLGAETRDEPDGAEVEFGVVHPASGKGRITYTDPIKEETDGGFPLGIRFYVPYQQSPDSDFVNDDVVDLVEVSEMIHRSL